MKLRNKKTGEIVDLSEGLIIDKYNGEFIQIKPVAISDEKRYLYGSLSELNEEWEDYKPAKPIFDDEKVSKAIKAWLSIQAQPIEAVSILCSKDSDGFFCYHMYGYIAEARIVDGKAVVNNHLTAICFYFRSDVYFEHERGHDYSITELIGEEAA